MGLAPNLQNLIAAIQRVADEHSAEAIHSIFKSPVILVSAPRAGSTLLFELLAQSPDFWTVGGESHPVFMSQPGLRAENPNFDSGRLTESHATDSIIHGTRAAFLTLLQNRDQIRFLSQSGKGNLGSVRFLEKTPRNALNIEFMLKIFPDAKFVFLHRDPRENIASIMEAWNAGRHGGFVTFPNLSGWSRGDWCLLLPPGWRKLNGASLAAISAFQWRESNQTILDDLENHPEVESIRVSYADLVAQPMDTIKRICEFSNVTFDTRLQALVENRLPLSSTTMTPPNPDKWKKYESEIMEQMPSLERLVEQLNGR